MKKSYSKVLKQPRLPWQKTPIAAAVACLCGIGPVHAQMEEVLVTATGRQEMVKDIPYNITAVSAEDLDKAGVTDVAALSRQVPGLVYNDMGARANGVNSPIVLRGLNGNAVGSNGKSPSVGDETVSVYLNQTPLFTNLRIRDVQRVEVLRGPQGTLYGASSVGGTVRFMYNNPDPTAFSGSIDTKLGQTEDADDLSYAVDGVVNLPITDDIALRVSAGYEFSAGVTDATRLMQLDGNGIPVLADPGDYFGSGPVYYRENDVDESDISYLRASLLWNINEDFDALLSVHHQENNADDYSGQSIFGPDRQSTRLSTSPMELTTDLYSLELTGNLGFATLISASSYSKTDLESTADNTNYGLRSTNYYARMPRLLYTDQRNFETERFTQEFRLQSNDGEMFDWVVGAYYSDYQQLSHVPSTIAGWVEWVNTPGHPYAAAQTGNPNATWADYYQAMRQAGGDWQDPEVYIFDKDSQYTNKSVFGELTWHITPEWQVTGGARFFWVKNDRASEQWIPFGGPSYSFNTRYVTKENDHIFKLNTSYDVTGDHKLYATWAEGFRQGGANALALNGPYAEDASLIPFDSDYATNWEIGAKGQLFHRLTYSAAVFYIEWEDMQVQMTSPNGGIPMTVNGGNARSQGFELELRAQLTDRLDMTFGYTHTDAELTEDFYKASRTRGSAGDDLPGVPRHTAMIAFNYLQPLPFGELLFHLDGAYRSGITTALNDLSSNYWELDGYDTWNASVTWRNETFRAGLFVSNITDELGISSLEVGNDTTGTQPGSMFFTQTPRTIGITAGMSF